MYIARYHPAIASLEFQQPMEGRLSPLSSAPWGGGNKRIPPSKPPRMWSQASENARLTEACR